MLKGKLEALLFSSGRKMDIEELSRLTHAKPEEIQNSLTELKKEYDEKDSSVMIVNEGNSWKLTVREQFLPLVQKIVTETELSKTVTETLAVIAFKYPIKQSDLIKIRTNKAYDHLKELEEMGYITRQKHGRTYLIKLTQKFFEYFDLPEEKLKEKFQDFRSIAKAIEDKETEIEAIKQEQKAKAEEEKQKDEKIKKLSSESEKLPEEGLEMSKTFQKEVDLVDEEGHNVPLGTYENKEAKQDKEKSKVEVIGGKIGDLKVVDEPSEEELEKERERIRKIKEEDQKKLEEKKEKPKFEGAGIKVTPEMEKIIDKKVERILHPSKEEQEEVEKKKLSSESDKGLEKSKTFQKEKKEPEEEPKDLLEAEMEDNKENKK
jgi:segregation and condensation protein B